MEHDPLNPIQSITAVTKTGGAISGAITYTNLPVPNAYTVKLVNISGADAGRAEDLAMDTMVKGKSIRIDVTFPYLSRLDMALLLTAINTRYMNVSYLDPEVATGYITKRFYIGDRTAPLWNAARGMWESLSFAFIQQNASTVP